MRYPRLLLLGLPAMVAVTALAVLLWPGSGQHEARAYPGLTAGIDADPINTTNDPDGNGIYDTVDPAKFDRCLAIAVGAQVPIDVFVLDVLDLQSFAADLDYDGSVLNIIGAYTGTTTSNPPKLFMSAQTGSDVTNSSQNDPVPSTGVLLTPDTDGKYQAAAFDHGISPPNGDDGSGTLVRIKVEAIADGTSPFNIASEDIDGDTLLDRGISIIDVRGVPDGVLGDANGDGFFDGPFINAETTIAVGTQADDDDGDGWPNGCDNCPDDHNWDQIDTDGDGDGDMCDDDDDNDGIPDSPPPPGPDNCRLVPNPADADGDGQDGEDPIDGVDNDADTQVDEDHETGQDDFDNDGYGDACDDSDSDGVNDDVDNCRSDPNADQSDIDSDDIGDVCDPDMDGDGVDNGVDNCPSDPNPDQTDTDGDGAGDACDDSDGDGVLDVNDNCPANPNPGQTDDDSDDVGNVCDNCRYAPNPPDADDDGEDGEDPIDGLDNDADTEVDEDHETGQENADNDALGDVCDSDDDNDTHADTSDNCPLVANGPAPYGAGIPGVGNQTDTDADGAGDPCDPDADSDGYWKDEENLYGSMDWVDTSRPEGCDGSDNDGDTEIDEGLGDPATPFPDTDGDTTPDCMDEDADTDGDTVADKFDDDDDNDGAEDWDEVDVVTDSLMACPQTGDADDEDPDAWPPDFNDDRVVNITDVFKVFPPVFGSGIGDPEYGRRRDLNPDGVINITDVFRVLPPVFGSSCTP